MSVSAPETPASPLLHVLSLLHRPPEELQEEVLSFASRLQNHEILGFAEIPKHLRKYYENISVRALVRSARILSHGEEKEIENNRVFDEAERLRKDAADRLRQMKENERRAAFLKTLKKKEDREYAEAFPEPVKPPTSREKRRHRQDPIDVPVVVLRGGAR